MLNTMRRIINQKEEINPGSPGLFVRLRLIKYIFKSVVFSDKSEATCKTSELEVLKQSQRGYVTPPPHLLGGGEVMK